MTRPRSFGSFFLLGGATVLGLVGPINAENPTPAPLSSSAATTPTVKPQTFSPELVVLQALQAHPITAPYGLSTAYRNGQVVLTGVVGTKQIHDVAIRLAIASGYPVRDDLIIDTAAAHRVAAASAAASAGVAPVGGRVPALGAGPGMLPYIYPPPLFGRLDDPFFGFEPPLVSYAPWFGATAARAPINIPAVFNPGPAVAMPAPIASSVVPDIATNPGQVAASSRSDTVEMTIDTRGVVVLRGTVPNLEVRIALGQKIARTPGVSEVVNLLEIAPAFASNTPPPPPQPEPVPNPKLQAPQPVELDPIPGRREIAVDADAGGLGQRLAEAIKRRPNLANLPIKVAGSDGVATLSGSVPTVYEAMLAFRAVQQTPGVREVVDRLEFVVPDGERKNPLLEKGRPEDVEPYLLAQVRRHLGDLAHVDLVRVRGDALEVRGSLRNADDRPRLEATLRSIPVLRGFRVEPAFTTE